MAKLIIEIERPDGWNKLTTVRVDDSVRRDDEVAWAKARDTAKLMLGGWRSYFGSGERLRISEETGW